MGASVAAAALGGGSSLVNTAVGIRQNSYNAHLQEEQNALNRDWQTQEAEKARQYNTQERLASQQFAVDMMNKQNEYNTPVNQASRLRQAGLNPALAMGGNVQSVSASSSPSSPQSSPMPSQVAGISPVSQPLDLQIPSILNGVGSFYKNLADAKKTGVDTDVMLNSFDALVRSNILDVETKGLANNILSIDKDIKEHTKDAAISKAWDESKKAMYDALLASDEQSRQPLVAKLLESQNKLNDVLSKYHGENAELVGLEVANFDRKLQAYLNLSSAKASNERSQAALNNWTVSWNKSTEGWRSDEFYESLRKLRNENAISETTLREAKAAAAVAEYAEENKEIVFWKDLIADIVNTGTNAVGAFAHLKSAKAWKAMSDNQKANIERKIEQMQWEYGDKVTIENKTPSGAKKTRVYHRPYSKYKDTKD